MKDNIPNNEDFEKALNLIFKYKTICENADYVEIQSNELHRIVGGYSGNNHRMPTCCDVMRKFKTDKDEILNESDSGRSSKLLIRYKLSRSAE